MSGLICTQALPRRLAAQFRMVANIEKAHEERYRALLNNVGMKKVFEKQTWLCGNAEIGVIL